MIRKDVLPHEGSGEQGGEGKRVQGHAVGRNRRQQEGRKGSDLQSIIEDIRTLVCRDPGVKG